MSGAWPGLHLWELYQVFSKSTRRSTEEVAEALKVIRDYKAHSGTMLGHSASDAFEAALVNLEESSRQAADEMVEAAANKVETALTELSQKAAGGKTPGTSWKASLTDSSPWPDVEREARYHFGIGDGSCSIIKELDSAFLKLDTLVSEWTQLASMLDASHNAGLRSRVQEVSASGRVTSTEAYMVDVLLNTRADKRPAKIQQRILKMTKHGIEEASIQPTLWQRAKGCAMTA
jgi:hypothetical protein